MNTTSIDALVHALLYEGYLLYPYRRSSLKNQLAWTFGCIVPRAYSTAQNGAERWTMQTECLLHGNPGATLDVEARFLQLTDGEPVERRIQPPEQLLGALTTGPATFGFTLPGDLHVSVELSVAELDSPLKKGTGPLRPLKNPLKNEGPERSCPLFQRAVEAGLFRLRVRIVNLTTFENAATKTRAEALTTSLLATHTILQLKGGQFISSQNAPAELQVHADGCMCEGAWPVLVGEPGRTDLMLSAPIILGDYPRLAPESPGDFFDATEMDEMLTRRIQTLTADEKQAMAESGQLSRALLQRVESLDHDRQAQLHGAIREFKAVPFTPGDRVRLRPQRRADAFDLLLKGKAATVVAVEQDFESRWHLAVTVDDDPGHDLGTDGKPGHRFFFGIDEVEKFRPAPRILIAGIGNIFRGDDAFGVEVVQRLVRQSWPEGVRVIDFGIRGFDLAYALEEGYDAVILVDAYKHGGAPGDVCVLEPSLDFAARTDAPSPDAHSMDPLTVLRWIQAKGGRLPYLRLVGCEPENFGLDEGQMGLSDAVAVAIEPAMKTITTLVADVLREMANL